MLFDTLLLSFFALASVGGAAPTGREELGKRQAPAGVPDYVLKYAPLIYLHSSEQYFPTDLSSFLANTVPKNPSFQPTPNAPSPVTLNNVNQLPSDTYLTSKDEISENPAAAWLKGTKPDSNGKTQGAVPAAVIVADKGDGVVDAFYMFFYAYNYGGNVLRIKQLNFGNHVGDFEHLMIRFRNGAPEYVWYSQHANGQAFSYGTVRKQGLRPLAYSANGSHANYAIPGKHDHTIPNFNLPAGALEDDTDAGILWDPIQSAYWYQYSFDRNGDRNAGSFTAYDSASPTEWLEFRGRWGDQEYPTSDKRQAKLFGQAKFGSGPTGPKDKQLGRSNVCPDNGNKCILRTILVPRRVGDEEDQVQGM
ncbi:uncharacterized protein EI97DRAFT_433902 [Westerdykella ornata]|uniref:Vacuolar protein sorting-associated protein 62 n=1 Tax=Westerdykella ornata TaxID=318751 RepID=A0A6A6JJ31_WESOR|nr:uncharacterized protein EI97DRAFT_433902 [Westerdykella ornata]KAF2275968.1 hypothetical protein EI97DRAFT_433902 [Westerdykella ornata]